MSKLKKVLLMCTAYVLVAALAIGGTVAFLQNTDSDVNVMTTGNVSIAQHEYQRAEGVAHNAGEAGKGNGINKGDLVPFEQGQGLYPAVPKNNLATDYSAEQTDLFFWGDYVYSGTAGNGLWNDEKLSNVMDKMVFVENTGKTDAYFRTIIAFECPEGMEYSQGSDKEFMMNINGSSLYNWETVGYITIDNVRYFVMEATYQNALKPGNTAHPSLLQVVMTHNATNEDMKLLGDTYEILVVSQAVQTEGFTDAKTALDTAFGKITLDNHPFPTTIYIKTNDEKKLMNALETDAKVIILTDIVNVTPSEFDGKGEEVTLAGVGKGCYGYLAFTSGKGNDAKVENLTVTGSGFVEVGHYKEGGGNYVVNNLVIKDLNATLAIVNVEDKIAAAFSQYGKALLKNCVMTGTTTSVEGWENFAYDASFVNGTKTTIEGGTYGSIYVNSQAHVTIKNAKVGKIDTSAITYKNLGMVTVDAGTTVDKITITPATGNYEPALVIKSGATVGVIDLSVITNAAKAKITIEDGATVNAFIDNGVEYATLDAWKADQ